MGKRGTEALMCTNKSGEEKILHRNRGRIDNWEIPVWVNNILAEEVPEFNEMSDLHSTIMSMVGQGRLVGVPVRWLGANNNIIEVDKMYKAHKDLKVLFLKNRNALRLIHIPAKTKSEILAIGADFDGKYNFPLLVSVCEKEYVSVNLF